MNSLIGETFGPYQIVERLGSGGFGEVYRATDVRLMRDIALKVLRSNTVPSMDSFTWFQHEARAASSLNHPNIVTIHDIGTKDSIPYIAMELVNGRTLRDVLRAGSPHIDLLLSVARQIAEGLAKAHEAGIVHRDLKPENLMITEDGLVKILDFGLAKTSTNILAAISQMTTMRSSLCRFAGTVGYMSPEQATGKPVDYMSDQFTFGTVLYEMAAGSHPFQRPSVAETISAITKDQPESLYPMNVVVPVPFSNLVDRCLSKDPSARYRSTREIARQLATIRSVDRLPAREKKEIVAVAPFEEISETNSCQYFCRGMTEEIRNRLGAIPTVALLSRSATSRPDKVIEGSVRFSLGRVRIAAVLVDATTGHSLWVEQYDRGLHDPIAVQTDVASHILAGLLPILTSTAGTFDNSLISAS